MNFSLMKVYFKRQMTSILYYLMLIFLIINNYSNGMRHWKWSLADPETIYTRGISSFTHLWSLWSASYSGGFILLLWGFWVFWQIQQPRYNGLLNLLFTKPLPYEKAAKTQLISLYTSGLLLFTGGTIISNIMLSLTTGYRLDLLWLILPPLISGGIGIIFYTTLLYLLSTIFQDWRVMAPLQFLLWIFLGLQPIITLNYRHLVNVSNPLKELALYQNRLLILLASILVYCLLKHVLRRQEKGINFSLIKLDRIFSRLTTTKLFAFPIAKIFYAIKIYYSWRILIACFTGFFLGGFYAWKISTSNLAFHLNQHWIIMFSQAILSLLGIITTLHLAQFEERANTFSILKTLPRGGKKAFTSKVIAMVIYFSSLILSFSLPLTFLSNQFVQWNQYFLALFPPFLFLFTLGYLITLLTRQLQIGYIVSGGFWLLFLVLEKKIPYWAQPFYEIAEYRLPTPDMYWINKGIFLGLSAILISGILLLEYRKMTIQR